MERPAEVRAVSRLASFEQEQAAELCVTAADAAVHAATVSHQAPMEYRPLHSHCKTIAKPVGGWRGGVRRRGA